MKSILYNLFIVTFGFTFSFMLSTALKDIYGGVGLIYRVGLKNFVIRSGIIGLTFVISGIYFFHVYKFIKDFPTVDKALINYYEIVFIMFLSMGSWLSYHIARIIFYPFGKKLLEWKSCINNVDVIFTVLFVVVFTILLVGFKIICKLSHVI